MADTVRKYVYVPPKPPSNLIDCTSFTINFTDRKFIHIGLDPSDDYSVKIHIITASRYVSITPDYLRRIFSLMGNILSVILDAPNKSRGQVFLKDNSMTLCKMVYRGENMLVIESDIQDGCRVLLTRENLLTLQDLDQCIFDSVQRKSKITRQVVLNQLNDIFGYLDKERAQRNMPMIFDEVKTFIRRSDINTNGEWNFLNQIKYLATHQVAERWYGVDEVDVKKPETAMVTEPQRAENAGAPIADKPIPETVITQAPTAEPPPTTFQQNVFEPYQNTSWMPPDLFN